MAAVLTFISARKYVVSFEKTRQVQAKIFYYLRFLENQGKLSLFCFSTELEEWNFINHNNSSVEGKVAC